MRGFNAGTCIRQGSYRSFPPTPINRLWTMDEMEVQRPLDRADRQLGRSDRYADIPTIELFIRMHVVREATRIEEHSPSASSGAGQIARRVFRI